MNYQNLESVLSAEAEGGFDNSWYHAQPHPIIVYYTSFADLKTQKEVGWGDGRKIPASVSALERTPRTDVKFLALFH